ncbi:hypothetical protein BC831DRAFT_480244 [Entophlyctis helioformis]|nr:hypothetical protein BC831DRAFT_480244 [Entophlyctis helioformis]
MGLPLAVPESNCIVSRDDVVARRPRICDGIKVRKSAHKGSAALLESRGGLALNSRTRYDIVSLWRSHARCRRFQDPATTGLALLCRIAASDHSRKRERCRLKRSCCLPRNGRQLDLDGLDSAQLFHLRRRRLWLDIVCHGLGHNLALSRVLALGGSRVFVRDSILGDEGLECRRARVRWRRLRAHLSSHNRRKGRNGGGGAASRRVLYRMRKDLRRLVG